MLAISRWKLKGFYIFYVLSQILIRNTDTVLYLITNASFHHVYSECILNKSSGKCARRIPVSPAGSVSDWSYWKVGWIVFEIFVYLLLSIHQKEIKTMPKTGNLCIFFFKKRSVSQWQKLLIYIILITQFWKFNALWFFSKML